jgi:hypothetical protein
MPTKRKPIEPPALIAEWALPAAATLGSMVRTKGIMLEIRAKLPTTARRYLDVRPGLLLLGMPAGADEEFDRLGKTIARSLVGIETLPVIPREIQDILTITTTERHRWLKDGRLPSAGTRTVKLRGRARKITFHVFDPRIVEEILDADRMSEWREADALAAAENRRQAAAKRRLVRVQKAESPSNTQDETRTGLIGWAEFERDGPLR